MRAAAIAGASGLTGQALLNALLDSGRYDPVWAILRRPLLHPHPRLHQRLADFANLESLGRIPLHTAFCTLGTTMRQAGSRDAFRDVDQGHVIRFARWAHACGARHFLYVSSVLARPDSGSFYLRVKGETEEQLAALGFERLDILQPGFLLGSRPQPRLGERLAQALAGALSFALTGPRERLRPLPASTVAAAMASAAIHTGPPGVFRHEWAAIRQLAALGR